MTHDGSSAGQLTDSLRDIASRIEQQRDCARDFATAQKERLQGIEQRLTEQIGEIEGRLDQWEAFQSETEHQHLELDDQRQLLEHDRSEMALRLAAVERGEADSEEDRERIVQELKEQQQKRDELKSQLVERDGQLESLQLQMEEHQSDHVSEVAQLQEECDRLKQEIETLESAESISQDTEELEDLRARWELAMDDVRSLKRENKDLQERLESMPAAGQGTDDGVPIGGFSWEEQKKRLLSDMADDEDDENGQWDEEQRSLADETIRRTDEVVTRMERQIDNLRSQLDQQQKLAEQVVQDASSQPAQDSPVLDDDEVIRQEREKLRQLQEEWTKKLGQAEVEIAVERAKNARQKAELDEKMRDLQAELDRIRLRGETEGDESVQSRLMKRLGLGGK